MPCGILTDLIPTGQLIDSFERLAGWYRLLISCAAAPPSPRAYQSAIEPTGIIAFIAIAAQLNVRAAASRR
jgi:hypothetical protein